MFVFPVYANSLCVSKSTHSGALPGPAYPYVDYHRSTEVHTVAFIPGPWKVTIEKVRGDAQDLALSGHDTGMMIPHLSAIMDNLMLPITLVSSSCGWPFVSLKKVATVDGKDKGLLGFLPLIAPFTYCDDPEDDTKKADDSDAGQGGHGKAPPPVKVNSDKLQKAKAGDHAGKQWLAGRRQPLSASLDPIKHRPIVSGLQCRMKGDRAQLKQVAAQMGIPQVNGCGRVYIPPGKTIMLRFDFGEIAMGWGKVIVSKAFERVAGIAFARVKSTARDSLERLDPDVALTVASKWDPVKKLGAALGKEAIWKLGFDGIIKSLVFDMNIKAPYGLFSYRFADGKGTFLWSRTFEYATPIDMKGIRGWATATMSGFYQPAVENLTKDNPNYAAGPEDDDSSTTSSQPNTGSADTNPAQSSKDAPKDYWTDPSQPSELLEPEPVEPEYLMDPSQADGPGDVDYWSDPSKAVEPGEH